jgi:sarcosine oxidase subunit alpha
MMRRLPRMEGEWIDRSRPLGMSFEGRPIAAFSGDTLTAALAAAGVMTTARSFKYHRRRGVFSAAGHDANNLFQIGAEPNQRGDQILAREGMRFDAVNTSGGVDADRAAAIGLLSRFLPVGFYYKAFLGRRNFPWFEKLIRRMSGLGQIRFDAPPGVRDRRYMHCDVAVIGGGLSGMSAALAAVRHGAQRVVIIEEAQQLGGSAVWHSRTRVDAQRHGRELAVAVEREPRIQRLCGHSVVGHYADHELAISRLDREDGGLVLLRAAAVVLATGCIEQPAVFRNNDLPGILLGSAAQRLLYRYGVAVGEKVVVLGANTDAAALALDLKSHGVGVCELALLEGSPVTQASLPVVELLQAGIRVRTDVQSLAAVQGRDGGLVRVDFTGAMGTDQVPCDCLLLSTGWMPAIHLALQAGATVQFNKDIGQHLPARLPRGLFTAGRVNGVFGFDARESDGAEAGRLAASHALGIAAAERRAPTREPLSRSHPHPLYSHPAGKEFVDLDEDLTLNDLANAAQEGFDSVELLKRYSTVGMGPSQGKLSNLNAARHLADVTGCDLSALGLTTARPPWQPVSLGALAGMRFSPLRRSPLDAWHEQQNAVWMPAGNWQRPAYYRIAAASAAGSVANSTTGSSRALIEAEVARVRQHAGLIDVSTLGKIDVMGPDAGTLLDRLYTGLFSDMTPGRTRYAVMVDEAGTVIDDGVIARLAPQHFYATTTTTGSASVYREMQRRVAEWQLDCTLHNLTGHFAAMNLAGPRSRDILARCTRLPLDAESFPYLALREAPVAGIMARIARVGFVGELGFEIHVPADQATFVWEALMEAGTALPLRPFGVEAQRILRLEKGHIIVGQDTDGVTNPFEAGMAWAVKAQKPMFVGQRSLAILKARGNRQRLTGFTLRARDTGLAESHLAIANGQIVGRITSVAFSHTLDSVIGLALLQPELAVPGATVHFRDDCGALHAATLVAPPFYDPQQLRQHAPGGA